MALIGGNINVNTNANTNFAKPGALQNWGANTDRTLNGVKATVAQLATNSFGGPGIPTNGGDAAEAFNLFEVNVNP